MAPLASDWDRGANFPSSEARQSRYGLAYLRSVCAQFGVAVTENSPDEDFNAVDATIDYAPSGVRVQVKCSTKQFNQSNYINLPVKEDWVQKWKCNFNPAFLLLVQVDHDPTDWIDYDTQYQTLHRASAYWVRVDTLPVETRSLRLLKSHRFTPETVRDWQDELLAAYGM